MKKYIYALLILFLFLIYPYKIDAIVKPNEYFYINDYANILSDETEQYILQKSVALNNVDGTQIVVVTVPSLGGSSLEEYANKLFREFGIGDSKKNNGLLLLLALEERQFRVEVGDGLGGILPDGKTGRFQDQYIIPYLKDNLWDEGIKNGYDAFYSEIVVQNNLNIDYNEPVELEDDESEMFAVIFYVAIISGMFLGTMCKTPNKKEKNNKKTSIYYASWIGLLGFSILIYQLLIFPLIFNLIAFLIARYSSATTVLYSGRGGRNFRGGGSSRGGGFSGGGGFSSGGGSSRRF